MHREKLPLADGQIQAHNPAPPEWAYDGPDSAEKALQETLTHQRGDHPSVKLYPGGVILNPARAAGNPTGKGGGKRGKVGDWSLASRRRLRQFLLTMSPPSGWVIQAATYTVPGPVLSVDQARDLWKWFSLQVYLSGAAMVWRLEVQQRGMVHWHAVMSSPPMIALPPPAGKRKKGPPVPSADWFRLLWHEALRTLGPVKNHVTNKGDIVSAATRMALDGALTHSAIIEGDGGRGAWLRYLQDHCSKAKQGQLAGGFGRHWGVVGKDRYERRFPDAVLSLSNKQYAAVRRAYERMATPSRKKPGVVFGRALGRRCKRGRVGQAVCFCDPSTLLRLVAWSRGQA